MKDYDFELVRFLPYRLATLSERVSKTLSHVYTDPHGLTVANWRVLVHTARQGAVSVREIHRTVNLEKPRVSRSVARLEKLGLLAKRTDPNDKRLVNITLTAKGQKVLDDILPKALAFERDLTSGLARDTLTDLDALITSLHERLDEIASDNDTPGPPR